jgi:hypothetical protein
LGTDRVVSSLDRSPNGRLQIERPPPRFTLVRRLVRRVHAAGSASF